MPPIPVMPILFTAPVCKPYNELGGVAHLLHARSGKAEAARCEGMACLLEVRQDHVNVLFQAICRV